MFIQNESFLQLFCKFKNFQNKRAKRVIKLLIICLKTNQNNLLNFRCPILIKVSLNMIIFGNNKKTQKNWTFVTVFEFRHSQTRRMYRGILVIEREKKRERKSIFLVTVYPYPLDFIAWESICQLTFGSAYWYSSDYASFTYWLRLTCLHIHTYIYR